MKFLLLFSLIFTTTSLFAQQSGTLDPSFGNKGISIKQSSYNYLNEPLKVTREGRILIGTVGPYGNFELSFQIDALLPDGSTDVSFGEDGSAHIAFPASTSSSVKNNAFLQSLALLPDGRILTSGPLSASGSGGNIGFACFKPNGSPDSTFGVNGTATALLPYDVGTAGSITLQPDGKFLIGGSVITNSEQNIYQLYTARFLANGSIDLSYNKTGFILGGKGSVNSIAVQKDNKIVAAGFSGISNSENDKFHIERYNEDGSYDNSFGINGIVNTQVNNQSSIINDLAIQEDGKLLVTGSNNQFAPVLTLARYTTDGSLDQSFGKGGIVTTNFPKYNGEGRKVFIAGEKSDKIIVAGNNKDFLGNLSDFGLVGYNADGSLDKEFGNGGIQTTNLADADYAYTADIQSDGKIVIIGTSYFSEPFSINRSLARYFGYPTKVPLAVRIKRFIHNHSITWNGLPADDNIAYYSVEQSSLSTKGFTSIAKLSGRSNLRDYSMNNNSLLKGTNYYRVKAVSTDGTIRYSEVVSADNIANTASVFPNPAKSYVTVQGLATDATANISIKDGSGTILTRGTSNGSTQYRSSVSNLLPGTYYLNITTAGKTEMLPFVKE